MALWNVPTVGRAQIYVCVCVCVCLCVWDTTADVTVDLKRGTKSNSECVSMDMLMEEGWFVFCWVSLVMVMGRYIMKHRQGLNFCPSTYVVWITPYNSQVQLNRTYTATTTVVR